MARQAGFTNPLTLWLAFAIVLFVGAAVFGVWSYMGRLDYKNNSDQKVAAAVTENTKAVRAEESAKYAEESKKPLKPFVGPAAYGSVTVNYPKTWSAYVLQDEKSREPLNSYFHPDFVPNVSAKGSSFALRVAIVSKTYSDVLDDFANEAENGAVTVSAYSLPGVPDVVGSRIDGEIVSDKRGSMVIFPVRNVTLQVWTESETFLDDFNNNILPNLTFAP